MPIDHIRIRNVFVAMAVFSIAGMVLFAVPSLIGVGNTPPGLYTAGSLVVGVSALINLYLMWLLLHVVLDMHHKIGSLVDQPPGDGAAEQ